MNKKFIGVGGVARAGKNLYCDLLLKQLKEQYGLNAKLFSLAAELKNDCASLVREKFNLDVFTENTTEKNLFRSTLVSYADERRKATQGRYWIEKLKKNLIPELENNPLIDVAIITDLRFDEYEKDEVFWLKEENKGALVHIRKYSYNQYSKHRVFTPAANPTELENDPKLQKKADYLLEWEDISVNYNTPVPYAELLNNKYLNNCAIECLKSLKSKNIL